MKSSSPAKTNLHEPDLKTFALVNSLPLSPDRVDFTKTHSSEPDARKNSPTSARVALPGSVVVDEQPAAEPKVVAAPDRLRVWRRT